MNDMKNAILMNKKDNVATKIKKELIGNWKNDDTGYVFSFDDSCANGLMDEIQTVDYEIVSNDEIRFSAGGIDLGTLAYKISKDKQTLVLGDSFTYSKTNEDVTQLSQKQIDYENTNTETDIESDESDESNSDITNEVDFDTDYEEVDEDTAFDYFIGTWKDRETGDEVVITANDDFIASGKAISEADEGELTCIYSCDSKPSYNCYFIQGGYAGYFDVGTSDGELYFECCFYNGGTIMQQSVEDRTSDSGYVSHIYDKVIK
jgi:hypothetical protein